MDSVELQQSADRIERQLTSPMVPLIVWMAIVGAFVYLSFLLRPGYRGDSLPYAMVLVAESYVVIQGLLTFWTILGSRFFNPRNFEYHRAQDRLFAAPVGKSAIKILKRKDAAVARQVQMYVHHRKVTVDVFIPVYGEPLEEIQATALAARDMYGLHTTNILDDGKSDAVAAMAAEIGVRYIRRPTNENAKAGNINYALKQTSGTYFAILDADFVASPRFLYETVPFFENDKLAFVQTPQYYDNVGNFVSTGANFMQHVFYSLIQSGKNRFNAAFCVGTNVVFRRSAIEEIGGMYDKSKSEDIWTSLTLHEHGYDSIYIPHVLAVGKTPETLKAYSKQQLRWATGSFEIFLRHNPLFARKLTTEQRLQYLATTSYYFVGFSVLLLLLLPPLQIYFDLSPINVNIPFWQWGLLYSSFYLTQLLLAFYTQGGLKLKTLLLANASFPIYVKAFFNALRSRDLAWQATNAAGGFDSPFNYVRMQIYIFLFLLLTSLVGFVKSAYTDSYSISLAWNILNTIVFGYFAHAALMESSRLRRERRRERKRQKHIQRIGGTA
jgi:cellulose synthase (UDP-forming)